MSLCDDLRARCCITYLKCVSVFLKSNLSSSIIDSERMEGYGSGWYPIHISSVVRRVEFDVTLCLLPIRFFLPDCGLGVSVDIITCISTGY